MKGYLSLVLHAHLPFVRHPEHDEFLEEDWLFEAITETYLPLIHVFDKLTADKIPFKATLSLSPTLISMLQDPLLQNRYLRYLEKSLELAEKELVRTRHLPLFNDLATMYRSRLLQARDLYGKYQHDPVRAFKNYQDAGWLEIITCAATHALLPLMEQNRSAVSAQIAVAVDLYQKVFGRPPQGFWLPECAYSPGMEEMLKEYGINYFFLDTWGILQGEPWPKYGIFAPVRCPSGSYVFGRDVSSSRQVWCGKSGYPGHPDYRDFYRDVGFDLDTEYLRRYIQPDGGRKFTGIKYHRVTGGEEKKVYNRKAAMEKTAMHAEDFWRSRELQTKEVFESIHRDPIFVCLFDAELFGHWWFEGPEWLDALFRKAAVSQKTVELTTPTEYLNRHPKIQNVAPSVSSWGEGGYFGIWLNEKNHWIYQPLHSAADRISSLAMKHKDCGKLVERTLNQAGRELLLAQASDWPFILSQETSVEYAKKRVEDHLARFNQLCHEVESGKVNLTDLESLEERDNIFPDLDFRIFCSSICAD